MSKLIPIGKVADVNPPIPKMLGDSLDTVVNFIPMAAVTEEGQIGLTQERPIREVIKGYRYFEQGDVLLAKITPCMENGKAAFVRDISQKIGFGSTEFHVLRPSPEIDGKYLFYMVWNPAFRSIAERNMTGTAGQKRVSTDFLKRYKIPLPPLEEQRRIAAILDKADEVRRKRQQAIALTEELLKSLFLDMFGDPVTNPKGWEVVKIGDISEVKTGRTPSREESDNYGGSVRWVKTTEVRDEIIEDTEEYLTDKGAFQMNIFPEKSILVAMYGQGATRGRTALLGKPCATNQACAVILPNDKYCSIYLWTLLKLSYERIRELGRGGNQPNLNLSMVRDFTIPLPPLEKQAYFRSFAKTLNSQLNNLVKSQEIQENLFNSLLQKAFRGEL